MTEKIMGPEGSKRRKRFWLVPMLIAVLGTVFFVSGALAVHDTGAFQMDGDASSSTQTIGPPAPDDWNNVCHQANPTACPTGSDTTGGATAVSWTAEPNLNSSIFTGGGSKDPIDINQWAWKDGAGGLPDKDNLLHAFAARYSLPPDTTGATQCPAGTNPTCEILVFGSDRLDNSGDAQQGFWFFQNKITLGSTALGGGQNFNGVHKLGDILVISNFSNGGSVSTITVYEWDPSVSGNLRVLETSTAAKCANTLAAGDAFCGIVNSATITMPWSFTDKSNTPANGALNGEFFEASINLSLLPGGLAAECFASVSSETRSSTSTTAVLKDFVLGSFAECGSKTETLPKQDDGSAIPSTGLSIGTGSVLVRDSAKVTVSGTPTFGGSVSFSLCGPIATGTCDTGGTAVGTAKAVSNPSPAIVLSDAATVTTAGRYCWRAEYSGDTAKGVPGSKDSSATECFVVNPRTPSVATIIVPPGPVNLGEVAHDTA